MTADPDSSRPRPALLAAVALISAAVLGFEIALTRVFAVLLWYHFAFLVISVALCGLGVGGFAAHWLRGSGPLSLRTLAALIVLVPFAVAGAFLAEAFVCFSQWSGRLYAWDLGGAAIAAVGVVGLLHWVGGIDACLAIAVVAAGAGLCVRSKEARRDWPLIATVGALLLVCASNRASPWLDIPPLPPKLDGQQRSLSDRGVTPILFTDLGTPGNSTRIVDSRWDALA
ncbi:MAG: hypothetical protein EXS13_08655 [Planctomycetes bacterium]|nr:hypothetical protein [Planctomycetota bacterium]